jgi:hypothetical protein
VVHRHNRRVHPQLKVDPLRETDRDTAERRLDELRLEYAAIELQEERVAAASRRVQVEINAFRDARKTLEAAYTATEEAAAAVLAEATGAWR